MTPAWLKDVPLSLAGMLCLLIIVLALIKARQTSDDKAWKSIDGVKQALIDLKGSVDKLTGFLDGILKGMK